MARVFKNGEDVALKSDPKERGKIMHIYHGGSITGNDEAMYGCQWNKVSGGNYIYHYGDTLIPLKEAIELVGK